MITNKSEETEYSILQKLHGNRADQQLYFDRIYARCFPQIRSYLVQNNGNLEDAQDVFQEVLLILLRKIDDPQFVFTSSPNTYLYALARNIWLNRLKSRRIIQSVELTDDLNHVTDDTEAENECEIENRLSRWISKITRRCQQIIHAIFFLKEPIDNLSIRMGWKNRHTADNQKYKCIQQLKRATKL